MTMTRYEIQRKIYAIEYRIEELEGIQRSTNDDFERKYTALVNLKKKVQEAMDYFKTGASFSKYKTSRDEIDDKIISIKKERDTRTDDTQMRIRNNKIDLDYYERLYWQTEE